MDCEQLIEKDLKTVFNTLNKFGNEWILICLKEGKSYIVASNNILLQEVKDILNGDIVEYYLECKEVWLRKEIIKVVEECP